MMANIGIEKGSELAVFRALDKLEKIGEKQVRKELKSLPKAQLDKLFKILNTKTIADVEKIVGCRLVV